jgi:prepilin-type N-terminal cleavage/methylation domain-containing protein
MKTLQKGFTLVEIAIVLVIIGLLLGGILKGQEMITQAKIKNVIADFSGVSAAFHGYQDRYRALPGDDKGAGRWAGITPSTSAGDGVIIGTYNATTDSATSESRMFWQHLRLSGFVAGTGTNQPFNAVTSLIGVQTGDAASPTIGLALGGALGVGGFGSLILCSANLPDKIAIAADTQMDDGNRLTGTVRGVLHIAPNPVIPADATTMGGAANYAETGTNTYTICRTL